MLLDETAKKSNKHLDNHLHKSKSENSEAIELAKYSRYGIIKRI
ncbi:MAG: hypothetical protein IRF12RH_06705 [Rickettsia helvetica]|uniref:Uncharacterized protein n=1 Tax=Rickettsia helvetica TaxID=35789 RepID=A0ABM9ND06_RICHE